MLANVSFCGLPLCNRPKIPGPEFVRAIYYQQQPHYQHDSGLSDQMMTRMTKGTKGFKSPKCSDLCGLLWTAAAYCTHPICGFLLTGFSHGFSQATGAIPILTKSIARGIGPPLPLYSFSTAHLIDCICPGFTFLEFDFSSFCSNCKVMAHY